VVLAKITGICLLHQVERKSKSTIGPLLGADTRIIKENGEMAEELTDISLVCSHKRHTMTPQKQKMRNHNSNA
jgi:hypothetical protein